MASTQPPWQAPPSLTGEAQERLPRLSVYNSLTRSKVPFVPKDREGKKVTWYACGPTVYDDAHLGHARNYVSTDIIRRILRDYFKFQVQFVMNITDVDDKIILAARQQFLLARWLEKHGSNQEEVRKTAELAYQAYANDKLKLLPQDTKQKDFAETLTRTYGHIFEGKSLKNDGSAPGDDEAKAKMHINTVRSAAEALNNAEITPADFAIKATGVLLPYIDSLEKHTVKGEDHDIFTKLTQRYEDRFFNDMQALNVEAPDQITRVTEYGPQIVDYVKKIQDNGFAYDHEGSVYYDITQWEASGGVYARLEPWNRNDQALQQDGEGSLSTNKTAFKKSKGDFALWKASKEGEPSWTSPWGEGRPGWHIECSAMASDVLGEQFDIHSGGIDLSFPHHDNELAQAEAYWHKHDQQGQQWVNYFLHMGHLSIQGSKMSKSLKNFITIRDALAKGDWTPRGLRIVFLLGNWKDGLEVTPDVVRSGRVWEERVDNIFIQIRDQLDRSGVSLETLKISPAIGGSQTEPLLEALETAKQKVHTALCDSFDTVGVMRAIGDLIAAYNVENEVSDAASTAIGMWITEIVVIFGLDKQYTAGRLGWSGIEIAETVKTPVHIISGLRDQVRAQAKLGKIETSQLQSSDVPEAVDTAAKPYYDALRAFQEKIVTLESKQAPAKDYLAACDEVRDSSLWSLGIYLEDRDGKPALVRPLSQSLREERSDREKLATEKAAAKAKAAADREAAEREKLEKGKQSHLDMFRTAEYSEWDADGLPTKDAAGADVAKAKLKKLKKEQERQKKAHEAWLATQK